MRRPLLAAVVLAVSALAGAHTPLPAQGAAHSRPGVAASARPQATETAAAERELVVLVHGLGRTSLSMIPLARALERAGFDVLLWGYSSTCCSVAELGGQLEARLRAERSGDVHRIHFVGHSLGTVIIRWVLAEGELPAAPGRVVMLAPPNQGSHEADRFARWWGWLLKPLPELRTVPTSTARTLHVPPGVEVGIIAGLHDGKVSVAETVLHGASHTVVPAAHSFLMHRDDVQRLTISFLRHGTFTPASGTQAASRGGTT